MKQRSLHLVTATLLTGWLTASALAQSSNQGIVDDWSSHHVIFSSPGTLQDAVKNGKGERWQRIVNDPRYRMQQARQRIPMAGQTATPTVGVPRSSEVAPVDSNAGDETASLRSRRFKKTSLHADWNVPLAPSGSGNGVALGAAPAKYSFDITSAPACTD